MAFETKSVSLSNLVHVEIQNKKNLKLTTEVFLVQTFFFFLSEMVILNDFKHLLGPGIGGTHF